MYVGSVCDLFDESYAALVVRIVGFLGPGGIFNRSRLIDKTEETAADCGVDVMLYTRGKVLSIEVVEAGDLKLVM